MFGFRLLSRLCPLLAPLFLTACAHITDTPPPAPQQEPLPPPPDYSELNTTVAMQQERANPEVSILGLVQRAGRYPFKPGMTVWELVDQAGPEENGLMINRVKISRQLPDRTIRVFVIKWRDRSRELSHPLLQPGDIVVAEPMCWGP